MPFNLMIALFNQQSLFDVPVKFRYENVFAFQNINYTIFKLLGIYNVYQCILFTNTHTQVGWVKADTKAIQAIHEHVITHNPRVTVSHSDLNTWNLHIKSVTEEDRGGYMCQLNTDPMKSQVSKINQHISQL